MELGKKLIYSLILTIVTILTLITMEGHQLIFGFLLLASVLVSYIIANALDKTLLGLGGLLNVYGPPIVGLITIIIFYVAAWLVKKKGVILGIMIFLVILNLVTGIYIRYVALL